MDFRGETAQNWAGLCPAVADKQDLYHITSPDPVKLYFYLHYITPRDLCIGGRNALRAGAGIHSVFQKAFFNKQIDAAVLSWYRIFDQGKEKTLFIER